MQVVGKTTPPESLLWPSTEAQAQEALPHCSLPHVITGPSCTPPSQPTAPKPLPMHTPHHFPLSYATWQFRDPPCRKKNRIIKQVTNQRQITLNPRQGLLTRLSWANPTPNRDHNLLWKSHMGTPPKMLTNKKLCVSLETSSFLGKGQSRWLWSPAKYTNCQRCPTISPKHIYGCEEPAWTQREMLEYALKIAGQH